MKHSKSKQKISLDDALQLAIAVHREGKPRLAAQHYTAILEIEPRHPDALHYMGVAQHQIGNHDGAIKLISRALEAAPDYVDARNNLGNVQKEMGRNADAEQSYRAVIAARPDFALAHNNLGVVLRAQDKLAEAAAAYRQAIALAPKFAQGWLNLGNVLKKTGDFNEALSAYRNGLLLAPENPDAYRSLARALVAQQRHEEALEIYRQWEKIDPDNPVVQHHIAACRGAAAPERASDAYVQTVFDRFADSFEQVLAKLEYRAPALCGELVASLLGEAAGTQRALDVLDAGCGTGLCGPLLRPYARRLEGVDLSAGMLGKAAERGDYDQLHEAELTAWLSGHAGAYDMIVSADTLCYFGALEAVLSAAAAALRPGGHLVFTLEATQDEAAAPQFLLHPHGRYSHAEAYVRATLAAAGLEVTLLRRIILRQEASKPVAGLLVGARKAAMKLRLATIADIPAMSAIRLAVKENVLSDPSKVTEQMYRDYLELLGRGWVAEVDGDIAGFCYADKTDASIWALFLSEQYEGRGIAKALLRLAVEWLFEQGHERITLSTSAGTRADRFYAGQGWTRNALSKGNAEFVLSRTLGGEATPTI